MFCLGLLTALRWFWWCCSGFGLLEIAFGGGCVFLGLFWVFLGLFGLTLCVICPRLGPDVVVIDLLDLWLIAEFCDFASIGWAWFWVFGGGLIVF